MGFQNNYKYVHYGFDLSKQYPLDKRNVINSINTIDAELPILIRYSGLIIFTKVEQKFYYFSTDLTQPIEFNITDNQEIFYTESEELLLTGEIDYSGLETLLNSTGKKIGKIVTIIPLNVSYIFLDTGWKYYNGTYNVTNDTEYNSIPTSLLNPSSTVYLSETDNYMVIGIDNMLNNFITEVLEITEVNENKRYYELNGKYIYNINGKKLSFDKPPYIENNVDLIENTEFLVIHNLNSLFMETIILLSDNTMIEIFPETEITTDSFKFTPTISISNVTIIVFTR